ncbi:hypothetical protein EXE58_11770 [Nocardioides seonyuensis]|uniref:Uncharacterized protein n=1 Tax=Nocardioides seonyuensis TaxID=2518371 RepID=A0A4P7IHB9_9ACTN|nr:hypothetical protein [Nocardioides seonyuensis]QBX56073.1 hypothetical protein EXE58_11770 [Nocardioides seonyuensis]
MNTPLDHPVMVTESPAGAPVTDIGRIATTDLSTVVFVPTHDRTGKAGIASDVLSALGKRDDVTGKPRNTTGIAEVLPIWLNAHRTRLLVVAACQRTPVEDLLALVEMAQPTATNILFATDHGYATRLYRDLASAAPTLVDWPALPATHSAEAPITPIRTVGGWHKAEPTLPAIEYWAFYATAKRQLRPDEFAPVHDLYCSTMQRLTDWLRTLDTARQNLTVALAHDSIKTLIEEQTTFDKVTVVTRAAQAAYHQHGWFLDIDERELRNGLIRFPPSKTTPDLYDRLRAYYEPTRAGTVALYLGEATPEAIRATTVDDLAQWHNDPRHPIAGRHVPVEAAPFLRAVLLARAVEGAAPDDPAFPGNHRRVLLDLRQAAVDLDLNIGEAVLNETHSIASRRVPTSIVKLERLA